MALKDYIPTFLRPKRVSSIDLMQATSSKPSLPVTPNTESEYGVSGTQNISGILKHGDPNPDFDKFQNAVGIYDKMRRTDAQIRALLQVIKLPLLGATWRCIPPDDGDAVDQQIADFVNDNLFDDDALEDSWPFTLRHILLQLDFGFSVLEKIWMVGDDGAFVLRRLAPRLPQTVRYWYTDRSGKLQGVIQYAAVVEMKTPIDPHEVSPAKIAQFMSRPQTRYQYLMIPADYACVFSYDKEGDLYEGQSILRPVYRNYWYKDLAYRLEGIRLDRWGVGIPVAEVQENHSLTDKELATLSDVLQAIRSNERAFMICPPSVRLKLMPEAGSAQAGRSGVNMWVDHHDKQIVASVLASFLAMGSDPRGTMGFGSRLTNLFISSLQGVALGIAGDLKKQVIRQLCDFNFDMTNRQYPTVTVADLEQSDVEGLVKVLSMMTDTFITPDDDTEDMLRKILKLPPLDPSHSREARAKQAEKAQMAGPAGPVGGPGGAPGATPQGGAAAPGTPEAGAPGKQAQPGPGAPTPGQDGQLGIPKKGVDQLAVARPLLPNRPATPKEQGFQSAGAEPGINR